MMASMSIIITRPYRTCTGYMSTASIRMGGSFMLRFYAHPRGVGEPWPAPSSLPNTHFYPSFVDTDCATVLKFLLG